MSDSEFRSLDERLRNLETGMAAMIQQIDDHTNQDAVQFGSLGEQLGGLDEKIDAILIEMAEKRGAINEARMAGAKWGGSIGAIVIAVVEGLRMLA